MVCLSLSGTACCWPEDTHSEHMRSCTAPSQDLDFATRNDTPLPEIAEHVRRAFQSAGYNVRLVEAASLRYARLVLRLPGSGEELEVDLLKARSGPRAAPNTN